MRLTTLTLFLVFAIISQRGLATIESAEFNGSEAPLLLLPSWRQFERLVWEEKPHAAESLLSRLAEDCSRFESAPSPTRNVAETALVCALVRAEQLERSSGIVRFSLLRRYGENEMLFRTSDAPEVLRYNGDARLSLYAPPEKGDTLRRALLPLAFWARVEPGNPEPEWLTKAVHARLGNYASAMLAAERASAKSVSDAQNVEPSVTAEKLRFGTTLGGFYSAATGVGLGVQWREDRLGDSPLSLNLGLQGATRSYARVSAECGLPRAFEKTGVFLAASAGLSEEDFYIPGVALAGAEKTVFSVSRAQVLPYARREIIRGLHFDLGWALRTYYRRSTRGENALSAVLPDNDATLSSGPFALLQWDSRDSVLDARSGLLLSLGGEFPQRFLGGEASYEAISADAEASVSPLRSLTLRARARAEARWGEVPFSAYAKSGADLFIPGVLPNRFQGTELAFFSPEVRYRVWGPLTGALFASAIYNELYGERWQTGLGTALEWNFSRYRDRRGRFEFARTAGEWVFQASLTEAF